MASQDNQVLELLEKAKKELEALESIKFRNSYTTNLIYKIGTKDYNLNVLTLDEFSMIGADLLMVKHFKSQANKWLGIDNEMHLGYPISIWEEDIENKVKVLKNKKRRALLNTTIASLDNLMSKELKDEIELQRIINLLANG